MRAAREGAIAIAIAAVSKRFGPNRALDGASLEVRAGEILGLLGPNGAGKTTLVRCTMARARPDAGTVAVLGEPAGSVTARAALGWVPRDLAVYPRLSARENLAVFGRYHGLSARALREASAWCLSWAALADRADEPVQGFSGGMKRRLNMATGLIHRPRIVLLDEPTVGGGPQSRERIYLMIEELRRDGVTVVYTTHYMEEAERLCDRIAIVDRGRVVALGTRDELVQAAFGAGAEVTLVLADAPSEAAAAWLTSAGARRDSARVQLPIADPARELPGILLGARERGLAVRDLRLRAPSLESVFLHLTGRELRE